MKYPIYIPSKGREDNQKTVKLLLSPSGQNEYGMKLITFKENQTIFKDEK